MLKITHIFYFFLSFVFDPLKKKKHTHTQTDLTSPLNFFKKKIIKVYNSEILKEKQLLLHHIKVLDYR